MGTFLTFFLLTNTIDLSVFIGGLMLISLAVFGSEVKTDVSWSYAMAAVSNILCLCVAILSSVQLAKLGHS